MTTHQYIVKPKDTTATKGTRSHNGHILKLIVNTGTHTRQVTTPAVNGSTSHAVSLPADRGVHSSNLLV